GKAVGVYDFINDCFIFQFKMFWYIHIVPPIAFLLMRLQKRCKLICILIYRLIIYKFINFSKSSIAKCNAASLYTKNLSFISSKNIGFSITFCPFFFISLLHTYEFKNYIGGIIVVSLSR